MIVTIYNDNGKIIGFVENPEQNLINKILTLKPVEKELNNGQKVNMFISNSEWYFGMRSFEQILTIYISNGFGFVFNN